MKYNVINTEKVVNEVKNLKNEKKKLEDIFDNLDKGTHSLEEYWDSYTSEEFFASFEDFKNRFKDVLKYFDDDISFLENVVVDNYLEYEQSTDEKISEDIAI